MDQRTKILGILAWVLIALGIVIVLVVLFSNNRKGGGQEIGMWAGNAITAAAAGPEKTSSG